MHVALLLLLTVHVAAAPANPATYQRLTRRGIDALKAGQYEKGVEAFKELEKLFPQDSTAPYNIACGYSLLGKREEAMAYLRKAVSLGFPNLELFQTDPDLANVRGEKGYRQALAALKAKLAIKARVRRDGKWTTPEARELVPGDVIRVRLGDIVPADARLLEGDPVEVGEHVIDHLEQLVPVHRGDQGAMLEVQPVPDVAGELLPLQW